MLPKDLIDKYLNWKENNFSKDKIHFEKLAKEGQSPEYIVISCVDQELILMQYFKLRQAKC